MWHELPYGITQVAPSQVVKVEPDHIRCCIRGCQEVLARAHKGTGRWNPACFCPTHGIRVSTAPSYVYRREEAYRNFIVDRELARKFADAKTEKWRLPNESSEDALTWNVFVSLARQNLLADALHTLTGIKSEAEPRLLLWGNEFREEGPRTWNELQVVRERLEGGFKIQTEPDVALHVPGRVLVLIEAKFGSGNGTLDAKEAFEAPEDFLEVYSAPSPDDDPLDRGWIESQPKAAILEQLCRMAIFGSWLRGPGEEVVVVNLLRQAALDASPPRFATHLRKGGSVRFVAKSWEELAHLAKAAPNDTLHRYMTDKTLHLAPAFPSLHA